MKPSALARPVLSFALVLATCTCKDTPEVRETAGAGPPLPVVMLEAHRDATRLWHDGDLWVSTVADFDGPFPIRLSRNTEPIARTASGWVAGVHGGRAYVVVPDGDQLAIKILDLDGDDVSLGTIPGPLAHALAVTASGDVVAAGGDENLIFVVGQAGIRRIEGVIEPGDAIWGMATDPRSPRLAIVLQQTSWKNNTDRRPSRLYVVDTQTGAVTSRRDLGDNLSAIEGEVAFDTAGGLWLHRDDHFVRFVGDRERTFLTGSRIDARNLIFAPDGSAIAYTVKLGGGHMWPATVHETCQVYFVRTAKMAETVEPILRFDTGCYFGIGLAIVDETLWVAPR